MSEVRGGAVSAMSTSEPAASPSEGRSLGELLGEMTSEVATLVRKEIELAKVEVKEEAGKAGKGVGMLAVGGIAGFLALTFLSFGLAWLLDHVMARSLAFAIVGVLYAIVAAVLVSAGRKQMKTVNPVPEQTVETLKEDAAWARAQRS